MTSIYYDFDTKNKSFLEMHHYLKSIGVENNKFMLTITDRYLIGVDPYNPALSVITKHKIVIECWKNPWYFFREVLRVPVQGGGSKQFNLKPSSMAQIWLLLSDIPTYTVTSRQTERTIQSTCIATSAKVCHGATLNVESYNFMNGKCLLERCDLIQSLLPDYILNTSIKSEININLISDLEYCEDSIKILKYMMDTSKGLTIAEGMISDESDKNGFTNLLNESFCRWKDNLYDYGPTRPTYIKYDYNELGYSSEWFDKMSKSLGNKPDVIRRELLLKRKSEIEDT